MKTVMLGLLAETPIHPGTGRSMGVVDLPVAREAATDYPVLVGSGMKGALRDKCESSENLRTDQCFGKPDQAGDLLVSDGRLLLLPVRSLTGMYRWVTCPHLIERYRRDLCRADLAPRPRIPSVQSGTALQESEADRSAEEDNVGGGNIFLEERQFAISGEPDSSLVFSSLVEAIAPLVLHEETQERLAAQLTVLGDDDFAWFVRFALSVQARNVLKDDTKKSKNLWYEETLPPDTLMYSLVMGRSREAFSALDDLFPESDPYLQAGGNETVGQGWFAVKVRRDGDGGAGR